jgi:hypothetical protein
MIYKFLFIELKNYKPGNQSDFNHLSWYMGIYKAKEKNYINF